MKDARRSARQRRGTPTLAGHDPPYWSLNADELCRRLQTSPAGLSPDEAAARRERDPRGDAAAAHAWRDRGRVLWNQLRSPLLLILLFAACVSFATRDWFDAAVVLAIVGATTLIGYVREYKAQTAAAKLRARIQTRATVLRGGGKTAVLLRDVVAGDVILLSAGNLVPADAVVLECTDLFVNQAMLTGESFPVEKRPGPAAATSSLAERRNCVFQGSNVRTGTARCVVVETGPRTQLGAIAGRLALRPPETEFDRSTRRFGYLLARTMFVIVVLVFAANVFLHRPVVQTMMFSVALAVGLSPELLPVILSVSLARGAQMMAEHGVLVRRLSAIENLGSMDVLCTDKTGTLTEGVVGLDGAFDADAAPAGRAASGVADGVLELASLNAALQSGLNNPLDEAILAACRPDLSSVTKLGEIPYDFVRKRMSVVVRDGGEGGAKLITKGAVEQTLDACTTRAGGRPLDDAARADVAARVSEWNESGLRVLAVATRRFDRQAAFSRSDERDLELRGFLTFLDRPKAGAAEALADLKRLGVSVKLITGDAAAVARHVASLVGMPDVRVLTGRQLAELHTEALWRAAERTDIFAEVDPNQKEQIILSLKKTGHVVGFLGDGVNDAPAMHAADTGISVERAVDVAREAADFVLMEQGLDVIRRGIEEGRRTFANTLKYVLMTTSANLGNMISMAAASLYLPFLPLLSSQILLNNFLSDIPALGLASDNVDPELVDHPRRWDMQFIRRFMVQFGLLSSCFDFLTFATLLWLLRATETTFRTAWFVESLLTELLVAVVIRTRRPFVRSRPGAALLVSTSAVVVIALTLPYLPVSARLGFAPLPPTLLALVGGITFAYVLAAEVLKGPFFRRLG